ncbi:PREDICTED: putative neutral sphingomyelinase [Branchiostoma belcheri]|uniref:sphingomyelin phosphodiesterase n=1 Tax=Branchiostoma belcheri TaxID=7741 RepID=A0A6P4ZW16_BRABE|nr:PREDICTED: putative neutral sphingomyelinase [Branchiostoma belcheri]
MVMGISFVAPKVSERFHAIGEELATGKYDLVALQEVWSEALYEKLVSQVEDVLPYHHYFYSGWNGSGVCVFSKHPIIGACQYRFTLNGHAHKLFHADWYGGKVVGLCRIQYAGTEINFYASHTHAEYNHDNDEYRAHRVSQAFELSQFIRYTGQSADVNILAGDLNNQPFELGLKIIQSNSGMEDAWLTAEHKNSEDSGMTCGCPENEFNSGCGHPPMRIDYVFYKGSARCSVKCVHCETTMHKVPGKPFNYSDHEGVLAHLELEMGSGTSEESPANCANLDDVPLRDDHLREAITIMEEAIACTASVRWFYAVVLLLCLILILLLPSLPLPILLTSLLNLLSVLGIGWSFWMGAVVTETERRGLLATRTSMQVLLRGSGKKRN